MRFFSEVIDQSILVLSVIDFNQSHLESALEDLLKSVDFHQGQAVILDIQTHLVSVNDCAVLLDALTQVELIVIGLKSSDTHLIEFADSANLALFNQSSQAIKSTITPNIITGELPYLVNKPVKSGEQIYIANKELVVLCPIRVYAEVLSDKSLAVYESASGKLFAGINGDINATIFVQNFQATLVSIAGVYKIFDTIPDRLYQQSVLISLKDGVLIFTT